MERPRRAFFVFPKGEDGDGATVAKRAINEGLFTMFGCVSSQGPRHLRISCAFPTDVLERGVKILHGL